MGTENEGEHLVSHTPSFLLINLSQAWYQLCVKKYNHIFLSGKFPTCEKILKVFLPQADPNQETFDNLMKTSGKNSKHWIDSCKQQVCTVHLLSSTLNPQLGWERVPVWGQCKGCDWFKFYNSLVIKVIEKTELDPPQRKKGAIQVSLF